MGYGYDYGYPAYGAHGCAPVGGWGGNAFVLIVVLFILLIIVGAAYIR
ncbi:YjcZ family sporulation protein [Bacillaceae bacterium YX66]